MIYAKPSTSLLVVFKAYLASDHVSAATGKTIAITISKNGGAFGNPNAGATNATEISSGWYKVTLDTTDTGTAGPLAVRGAVATVDDVGVAYYVGQSPADVTHLLGTAHLAPGTAGTPDVNAKLAGGTAWGSGAITAGAIANAAIDAATFATDTDVYTAKGWLQRKSTATANDTYVAVWLKNGVEVTSGITLPKIQVKKVADGTDLIAETAMIFLDDPTNAAPELKYVSTAALQTAGTSYVVVFKATIDGSVRTYRWPQGRDV
jgi:hypothetical protein